MTQSRTHWKKPNPQKQKWEKIIIRGVFSRFPWHFHVVLHERWSKLTVPVLQAGSSWANPWFARDRALGQRWASSVGTALALSRRSQINQLRQVRSWTEHDVPVGQGLLKINLRSLLFRWGQDRALVPGFGCLLGLPESWKHQASARVENELWGFFFFFFS